MDYINKEEKESIESYERDEWISIAEKKKSEIEKAAKNSSKKNKRINIRLTEKDYHDIQVKAMEEGVPYQTLISSIIHKYNKGEMKSGLQTGICFCSDFQHLIGSENHFSSRV